MCRILKAQQKQQVACEIDKIASAMHTLVLLIRFWRLKNAQVTSGSEIFDALMERTKTEQNEQMSDRNGQSDEHSRFALLLGVESLVFLMQNGVRRSSNMCFRWREALSHKMMTKGIGK